MLEAPCGMGITGSAGHAFTSGTTGWSARLKLRRSGCVDMEQLTLPLRFNLITQDRAMTIERAKEIADDSNKPMVSLAQLREAAAVLSNSGWHASADNIHIPLRLRRGMGPFD
jgi:hypothetical protein